MIENEQITRVPKTKTFQALKILQSQKYVMYSSLKARKNLPVDDIVLRIKVWPHGIFKCQLSSTSRTTDFIYLAFRIPDNMSAVGHHNLPTIVNRHHLSRAEKLHSIFFKLGRSGHKAILGKVLKYMYLIYRIGLGYPWFKRRYKNRGQNMIL